jgi:hypothetical protein
MELVSFLVNFLAILGFIIIISYSISYLLDYFKQVAANNANKKINPPYSYMQTNGIKCPDYLTNTTIATNKDSYTCSNRDFNINTNNATCFSDTSAKTVDFPVMPEGKTWELGNPGGLTSMTDKEKWDFVREKTSGNKSRCNWIKDCGNGADAVWQGVNKICNSVDPSQSKPY